VLHSLAAQPLDGTQVTLVSPFPRTVYSGMVPGLVAGHYSADECQIPLAPLAARAGVEFVRAAASGLDADRRLLRLGGGRELGYDALSLDIGAVMDRNAISGAREHALFVRPMEHFIQLWHGVLELARTRPLRMAVVGGGAAGVELALALRYRLGAQSGVSLVTGGVPVVASAPPATQRLVRKVLARRQIEVIVDSCTAIAAGNLTLGGGAVLACDAPLLALGATAPAWLAGSSLALDAAGFVATGATLQSLSHPEVFAVGDVASRGNAPRPKSGVHAVRAGPPLLHNLRQFVGGGALQPHVPQARALNLLACGERRAIASWGSLAAEGAWAWWWKDRIDRRFVGRYAAPEGPS